MEILPKALGTRPRLAVEIRWGGVVAARAEDASTGVLTAVSRAELPIDAVEPGLRAGNFKTPASVAAAVRKTLEAVTEKGVGREVTLVVPDSTVRVLLLDFDSLPAKAADALPVVRFRLKKLLPFDADDAAVSYQIMQGKAGGSRGGVRVVAVAIPREVLAEYEAVVREAGFEPGAVLPSTMAAISGLGDEAEAGLVVNAGPQAVTTAIVQGGVLVLHRSVDMSGNLQVGILAEATVTMTDAQQDSVTVPLLPLINVEESQQEWAMQEPVDPFGRDVAAQEGLRRPLYAGGLSEDALVAEIEAHAAAEAAVYAAPVSQPATQSVGLNGSGARHPTPEQMAEQGYLNEVTQAVSVAAAYFEDTLEVSPGAVLSAGSVSAQALGAMLAEAGFGEMMDAGSRIRVREVVGEDSLAGQAVTSTVPRGWLAGVRGALRS
jgi:type IV pilus assembly protein PilM